MSLPLRVQKVLDDWNVAYTVSDRAALPKQSPVYNMPGISDNTAQLCILEDSIGKVQVIFPATCILDLNKLLMATARQFTPIGATKMAKVLQGLNLDSLPALPQVTGLDTYVDASLLEKDTISMTLGPDQVLEMPQNDFQTLISSARLGDFSSPVPVPALPNTHWATQDQAQINHAVATFTQRRISQRLEETLDMPPMPETAQKIIELRMDPNAETEQLAALVAKDPGLAAQVISWANSPYYGVSGTITSVQEAVVRVLGFDLVINLALGLSLGRTLEVPKDGPSGYTPYWQQSVCMASLMTELVRALPAERRPPLGMAYLCGLLQNFGHLLLAHVFPPHFALVNRHMEANPQVNRYFIEHHLLGITREQISSNLFKQWGLPDEVCTAIRYQNEPSYGDKHCVLSQMLYVAARMLSQSGLGDAPVEDLPNTVVTALGLDQAKAEKGMEKVLESMDDLKEMARQMGSA